ncbi:hypothetical protein [Qipengyuania aquimaris]|uniref:hypothetical protein n=1 Tax=Qipengyuania aquimaris TaxID=255984 RepID=UPI001FD5C58D|nr:hypothetical protein [Qipengyuania aquimaris]UOR15025.1 hypothetical protein LCM05_11140 [Qipengyuania aquimaris]
MNALVTIEAAPTAGPHGEGQTIFGPKSQAEFLQNLQLFGNVRLACRAARISAQTAYRQRRASPALAQAWDAALLAARAHAEATLADRALNGVEEAVFYHGEEVARRRRYDSRLLLAHLARLDRLEAREEVAETLTRLDALIDGLREGEGLPEVGPELAPEAGAESWPGEGPDKFSQDRVPSVPPCRSRPPSSTNGVGRQEYAACESCGGQCDDPEATLTQDDCQWFGNRLDRFYDARPRGVPDVARLASEDYDAEEVEALQMEAYEAGGHEWWLVASEEALEVSIARGRGELSG